MRRGAFIGCLMLTACNPAPAPVIDTPTTAETAPASDMVPISDLVNANRRFAHCKDRWTRRLQGEEDVLRSERRAREAVARRPDMIAAGILALEEERAEKRRLEMASVYSKTDSDGCFG